MKTSLLHLFFGPFSYHLFLLFPLFGEFAVVYYYYYYYYLFIFFLLLLDQSANDDVAGLRR